MTRNPSRCLAALACAAVLAVTATACGGGSDDGGAKLSAGEFRDQANALCKKQFVTVGELEQALGTATSQTDAEATLAELVTTVNGLVADIRALREPDSLTKDVDALLDEVASVTDQMDKQGLAYLSTLTQDPFTAANATAKDVGLDDCTSPTS